MKKDYNKNELLGWFDTFNFANEIYIKCLDDPLCSTKRLKSCKKFLDLTRISLFDYLRSL